MPAGDCGGGGTSFQQLLLLPDTWILIAVEEHAFPLGVTWFLAMTLRKRGSIVQYRLLSEKITFRSLGFRALQARELLWRSHERVEGKAVGLGAGSWELVLT